GRWDPVTVFFARDVGPAKGGPEDHPERLLTLSPPHPGAFTWLDARTLQFRPAAPWPPLARFRWGVRETKVRLTTLMAAPSSTIPADAALGLERVEAITLTFAEPIDPAGLARMVTIELRPPPRAGSGRARWMQAPACQVEALGGRAGSGTLPLGCSTAPRDLAPVQGRNLMRFTAGVDDLAVSVEGRTLVVAGDFAAEKPGRVTLTPAAVTDVQGRPLEMTG